jgi:hypothetical protein
MGHLFAGARGLVIEKRRPGVEDGKCAVRPRSPEGIATPCRYQSESFNLMQHCIFGRFRRFVGTDLSEFMGSIRTRSDVHILKHGVAGAFQIGVRSAEKTPALPNRRLKPLRISLTGGGDKGIAKPFALSQIDHMRSIANQLYALLYPRPTLRWQPGNAACREAPSEGPR